MSGKGSKELRKYKETHEPLSRSIAIICKCCECMSDYVDGREDCNIIDCPLYPYMPYRKKN